jgi:hypothetical protein
MKRLADQFDIHSRREMLLFIGWLVPFLAACWIAYQLS